MLFQIERRSLLVLSVSERRFIIIPPHSAHKQLPFSRLFVLKSATFCKQMDLFWNQMQVATLRDRENFSLDLFEDVKTLISSMASHGFLPELCATFFS